MSANVMTREQKLYAMRMVDIAEVAEKLGVKIDKKGKKSVAVQKILDAESKDKAEKPVELKEEYCGDGTPLAEVGKEIAEQAKKKSKAVKKVVAEAKPKKAREKKAIPNNIIEVLDYIEKVASASGVEKFRYKNKNNIDQYRVNGKRVFIAIFSGNRVLIECKSKLVENSDGFVNHINSKQDKKYAFDKMLSVQSLDADVKKLIESMIKQTVKKLADINAEKANKKTKKSKKGDK